jgi:uroporphyrin-III C-methyltransferase/precorrin-2 dehydrogenase/sirohydrochlorin ferrochelatase
MGLAMIERLASAFIAHGMAAEMPVAVIDHGTRRAQRVVTGVMGDIAAKAEAAGLKGPAIIIIGTVVSLRERLAWFEPGEAGGETVARRSADQ